MSWEPLLAKVSRHWSLFPGRLAGAYTTAQEPGTVSGISLDPDTAIVVLGKGLDGRPGPVTYAANLRTGGVMVVDPRLAAALKTKASTLIADAEAELG